MAPRRGGGGGSSSSSSGGGSDSPWFDKTPLFGSGWSYAPLIAIIVLSGILMVGIWVIAFWNAASSRTAPGLRIIYNWYSFKLALLLAILVYTFEFIHGCLSESTVVVAYVYFLIQAIIYSFDYLVQILLLATIYTIFVFLTRSFSDLSSSPRATWKALHTAHFCFCGILGALWIALLGLRINMVVKLVGTAYAYLEGYETSSYHKLAGAWYIMYMLASFEVVALSAFFFMKKTDIRVPTSVLTILFAVIALPFAVRSTYEAAVVIRSAIQERRIKIAASIAEQVIFTFATLIVYGGIVYVGRLLHKDHMQSGQNMMDQYGNQTSAAPPVAWPMKQEDGTQQSPPQYQRYVQPGTQQYPQQSAMYYPSTNTPVHTNGYSAPQMGQPLPYGSPPPQANGYPGMQQYGQQQPQPQQLAGSPVQHQTGELPSGPPIQRPGEMPVGQQGYHS